MDPLGLSLIVGGSLLGGFTQDRAAKRNLRAQQQRQAQIDRLFAQNRPGDPGTVDFLQAYNQSQMLDPRVMMNNITGESFDPATMNAAGYDATFADFMTPNGSLGQDFNVGQDALMQMIRADPLASSDEQNLRAAADTGFAQSPQAALDALDPVFERDRANALAQIQGSSRSVGQRFGSATRRQELDGMQQMLLAQQAQRAQIALGSAENSANRRAQAATALAQLALQGRGQQIAATQGLQQGAFFRNNFELGKANLFNQAQQFNATAANEAGRFNAANTMNAAGANMNAINAARQFGAANNFAAQQFNAQQGTAAQQQSFANRLNAMQFGLGALERGQNLRNTATQLFNQQVGIQAGVPIGIAQPSAVPGAAADVGQFLALLPFLTRQTGAPSSAPAAASSFGGFGNFSQFAPTVFGG